MPRSSLFFRRSLLLSSLLFCLPSMAQEGSMPIDNRTPLRLLTIRFASGQQKAVFNALQKFIDKYRFAPAMGQNIEKPDTFTLRFYRIDIKMIGEVNFSTNQLSLTIYRTHWFRASSEAIDHGVNGLRKTLSSLRGMSFEQKILILGDDTRIRSDAQLPVRRLNIAFDKTVKDKIISAIEKFCNINNYAVRLSYPTPDPDQIFINIYNDEVAISCLSSDSKPILDVAFYRLRKDLPDSVIDQAYEAFHRALADTPGVNFVPG